MGDARREELTRFVRYVRALSGDERGEAQPYLHQLFPTFGRDVCRACCPSMPVFFGVEMLWPIVWLDPEPDHQTKIDLLEAGFAAYSLFSEMAELDNEADED